MKQMLGQRMVAVVASVALACASVAIVPAVDVHEESKAYAATNSKAKLSKGVAATVNGKKIKEKTITVYVKDFRKKSGLTGKSSWRKWMKKNGYTAKSVRREVIDFYVTQELIGQAARKYGVKVSKKEVKAALEETKMLFGSNAAYRKALKESRLTEKEYMDTVLEPNLLQEKLAAKLKKKGVIKGDLDKGYAKWVKKYRAKANIKIAKMPKGLPYAV